eukprot:CAMPEP_0172921030 /NCGR_PEP_ID=MMETSP1075-20121228/205161_1 /TAXON_ID=2916 /ORGANISM="Ceratium fusus, Strain PA161109" /LENGTH=69 /DNA_ID=CAMNT_0013781137 /DNA_START=124 /DNA_END=333 /DNA_ORIENTATION=+
MGGMCDTSKCKAIAHRRGEECGAQVQPRTQGRGKHLRPKDRANDLSGCGQARNEACDGPLMRLWHGSRT